MRGKIVQFSGREARVTVIRDVSQRRRLEDAVHSIVLGTSVVGAEFFTALVRGVASTLGVRRAFVAKLSSEPATQLRTLALCADGQLQGSVEFALAGTPCEAGFSESACCYPNAVQQLFPRDTLLARWGAQSYLGVALFSAAGKPLGWLAAVHDRPLA